MQTRSEKRRLNKVLQAHGLPSLDAPSGLMEALGRQVVDHEHFRSLLIRCEPRERASMYTSLKPHLRFVPKPLDVYIAEAGQLAEAKQLPILEDGKLRPYQPAQFRTLWQIEVHLSALNGELLLRAMRYLQRDIPDEQLELVIYKAHIKQVLLAPQNGRYIEAVELLVISAGIYEGGEAQRIQ